MRRRGTKAWVYHDESQLVCHADLREDGEIEREHYNDHLQITVNRSKMHAVGRKLLRLRPWLASNDANQRKGKGRRARLPAV